jgi:hypothetical protein
MSKNSTQRISPTCDKTESELLDERRRAAGIEDSPMRNGLTQYRALAFSGGGIRSATFALGVLQAIATDRRAAAGESKSPGDVFRASRLSWFDYLSTVSGGGYLGGFLCSLFQPNRLRAHRDQATHREASIEVDKAPEVDNTEVAMASDDAVRVLNSGPPGRIRSDGPFEGEDILAAPLAWLRENGRYLIPTGAGDAFYAAALGIRNWIALHYVIGTVLVALLALVGVLRALISIDVPLFLKWEQDALSMVISANTATNSTLFDHVWWSSLLPLSVAPFIFPGLPLGIAFWLVSERRDGKSLPINMAVICSAVAAAILLGVGLGISDVLPSTLRASVQRTAPNVGMPQSRQILIIALGAEVLAAILIYLLLAFFKTAASVQRVLLTRGLATVMVATVCIACIAVLDTLGHTLYFAFSHAHSSGPAFAPAGLAAALVWLARRSAAKDSGSQAPAWLKKLPMHTLGGFAGILIFALVGAMWSVLVQWFVWNGLPPAECGMDCRSAQLTTLAYLFGVSIILSAVTGHFPGFINLSSLQAFYSARITRAYLGASNGKRFRPQSPALSAAEPLPGDDLAMEDYFGDRPGCNGPALTTFAPLHIINVTVNKTVDPAEQVVQRDRKGQPMAVLPFGFSIDNMWSLGYPQPRWQTGVSRPLLIGQWIGTSGAAFSTGIGRETSLGMSLLMGAANVRLGTWWESGLGTQRIRNPLDAIGRAVGAVFRTQAYISYELRARFFGTHRKWQYLSDGGHFENTGIYELLRKDRRVFQIFACDNGADPHYRFDDLANLIRLARIDLNVEIEVETEFGGALAQVFAGPESFQRMGRRPPPAPTSQTAASSPTPCALLLWASQRGDSQPSSQIVLLKPQVPWDADADVWQYAIEHPAFPQEPTADQFFDEAQWESYRALGFHLGSKIFNPTILKALGDLAKNRMNGLGS